MEQTLLLNATFEPIKIVPWQRAMTLHYRGKVEIVHEHDRVARAVTFTFRIPSVVRLLKYVRIRRQEHVAFTRQNIFARDHYTCQYCDARHRADALTFDHVIPVTQGGTKSWENIVTACVDCNTRKGGRTPEEAGMPLVRAPRRPSSLQILRVSVGLKRAPKSWADYLYWNVELET